MGVTAMTLISQILSFLFRNVWPLSRLSAKIDSLNARIASLETEIVELRDQFHSLSKKPTRKYEAWRHPPNIEKIMEDKSRTPEWLRQR
jgi:chromosome segregation ATPase